MYYFQSILCIPFYQVLREVAIAWLLSITYRNKSTETKKPFNKGSPSSYLVTYVPFCPIDAPYSSIRAPYSPIWDLVDRKVSHRGPKVVLLDQKRAIVDLSLTSCPICGQNGAIWWNMIRMHILPFECPFFWSLLSSAESFRAKVIKQNVFGWFRNVCWSRFQPFLPS